LAQNPTLELQESRILRILLAAANDGQGMTGPNRQVLFVRHGQSLHNADKGSAGIDPALSDSGLVQSLRLHGLPIFSDCELLVVSPLSRAVQTAAAAFGEHPGCRTVLTPLHTERCSSTSDQGRSKSDLVQRFPFIESWEGFAELEEEWTPDYSTDKTWRETRVPAFLEWLSEQPEKRIVVVGHGAFFSALLGRYLANCEVAEFVESAHGGRERLRGWQGL